MADQISRSVRNASLALAMSFLYLSRLRPDLDGGIYSYARAGFGDLVGFFSAWGYWLCATIGVVGYLVIAFAALGSFIDTPEQIWFGDGNTLAAFVGESCILWAVHLLVARGVQQAALFNLVATLAKSLPLLLFILFACYYFDPVTFAADQGGSTLAVPVSEQVRNTMLITLWVFTGIEGAAVLSARARNRRDVGTATVLGVVLALLLYVLISVLALGILSRPELAALPNPSMAGLMAQMTGSWGKLLISVGLIVSVLASYVSWTLFSAEVPFSAARHGAFPAIFRRQNRNGTPIASLCPTWVQTCMVRWDDEAPSEAMMGAYLAALELAGPSALRGAHLYGLARPSLQPEAGHLQRMSGEELEQIALRIKEKGLTVVVSP